MRRTFPQKCPFCPPQIKRTYDEIGLIQHVISVSKHNPNPETVRAHCVILNDVRKAMNMRPLPKSPLLHSSANVDSESQKLIPASQEVCSNMDQSARDVRGFHQNSQVKVVWPWMGIVVNIDYEQLVTNGKNNSKDSNGHATLANNLWNLDLKDHFSRFNPRGVHALWKQRLAVLDFGNDLLASFDAEDFAKDFAQRARGKPDFQNMQRLTMDHGQEMFGWIADENDYNLNDDVGELLRRRGTLRVMPQFSHTWSEEHDQLFQDMRSKLQDRNFKLIELQREVCNLQTSVCQKENEKHLAESQLSLKELKHKQELESIRKSTDKALQKRKDEFLKEKEKLNSLQDELRDLKKKCQLFEERSPKTTSDETILQQLIDAVEEKETLEDCVQKLTYKEREANDKVQNAMKAATEILKSIGNEGSIKTIGVKGMGVLNEEPWLKACAVRFKDEKDGWEMPCKILTSKWEEHLKDASWYPYKCVPKLGKTFEEVIDAKDEKLAKLKQDFGEELYKTVVDALDELKEFNPSGRFPVLVPWNFKLGRAAELDEIIRYLANHGLKRKRLCSFRG